MVTAASGVPADWLPQSGLSHRNFEKFSEKSGQQVWAIDCCVNMKQHKIINSRKYNFLISVGLDGQRPMINKQSSFGRRIKRDFV
jgi:hypothetical protein